MPPGLAGGSPPGATFFPCNRPALALWAVDCGSRQGTLAGRLCAGSRALHKGAEGLEKAGAIALAQVTPFPLRARDSFHGGFPPPLLTDDIPPRHGSECAAQRTTRPIMQALCLPPPPRVPAPHDLGRDGRGHVSSIPRC